MVSPCLSLCAAASLGKQEAAAVAAANPAGVQQAAADAAGAATPANAAVIPAAAAGANSGNAADGDASAAALAQMQKEIEALKQQLAAAHSGGSSTAGAGSLLSGQASAAGAGRTPATGAAAGADAAQGEEGSTANALRRAEIEKQLAALSAGVGKGALLLQGCHGRMWSSSCCSSLSASLVRSWHVSQPLPALQRSVRCARL